MPLLFPFSDRRMMFIFCYCSLSLQIDSLDCVFSFSSLFFLGLATSSTIYFYASTAKDSQSLLLPHTSSAFTKGICTKTNRGVYKKINFFLRKYLLFFLPCSPWLRTADGFILFILHSRECILKNSFGVVFPPFFVFFFILVDCSFSSS